MWWCSAYGSPASYRGLTSDGTVNSYLCLRGEPQGLQPGNDLFNQEAGDLCGFLVRDRKVKWPLREQILYNNIDSHSL